MSGGVNGISNPGSILTQNYTFKNNTFDTIQCWNERQNTSQLPIKLSSYVDSLNYDNNSVIANYNKESYHLELPLDVVIDSDSNIFDSTNLDTSQLFKSNLTSKYLYIQLTYNKEQPLVLNYTKVDSIIQDV